MRIMAVDYGDARIGLAVSDLSGTLAGEAWTLREGNMRKAARALAREARAREVSALVLGLPRNMDGTEGPQAEKCRAFGALLEKETGLPVTLWDERRSSVEAHAILRENGRATKKHRETVDAVAAALILEGYLRRL